MFRHLEHHQRNRTIEYGGCDKSERAQKRKKGTLPVSCVTWYVLMEDEKNAQEREKGHVRVLLPVRGAAGDI